MIAAALQTILRLIELAIAGALIVGSAVVILHNLALFALALLIGRMAVDIYKYNKKASGR